MNDFHRLRFVTANYHQLQGLRLVPLAVPLLLSGAWRSGRLAWVPGIEGNRSHYWFAGLSGLALVAAEFLGLYYRRRFGYVQAGRNLRSVFAWSGFAALLMFAVWTQQTYRWPLSTPALLTGCVVGYLGLRGGHVRPHYLALAALCGMFATLGSFGVSLPTREVWLTDLIGFGLILVGVGDHCVLRRTLTPVAHVTTL